MTVILNHRLRETVELDGDFLVADIINALRHLKFNDQGLSTIRIDREVCRYLIQMLEQRS